MMIGALGDVRSRVGESACWSARDARLYSVDIWSNRIWCHAVSTGHATAHDMPEMAAAIVMAQPGVTVALESHLLVGDLIRGDLRRIDGPIDHPDTHRFNDACVDPAGRLVIGTMRNSRFGAAPEGKLLRLDERGWSCLAEGFWTINGLAFSPDGDTIYWSDSNPRIATIWSAPYDTTTGTLGDRSVFADMRGWAGRPDGATVDAEGCYWIAGVGGACIYRFAPDGTLARTVPLPVENPTRVAFGGSRLSRLFVTSMGERLTRPDPDALAGAVLELDVGHVGFELPEMSRGI